MIGCGKRASSVINPQTESVNKSVCVSDGVRIACKQDRGEVESVSEIVNMSNKIRLFIEKVTEHSTPGERVSFEAMMTFAYTEGFKDGYAKGYTEAFCEPENRERNDGEL